MKELKEKDKNSREPAWSIMQQISEFLFHGAFDLAFGEVQVMLGFNENLHLIFM